MDGKRKKTSNEATGAGVARAAVERKDAAQAIAAISLRKDRELAHRGKDKPITQAMRDEALTMLANGMPMDRVTDHFGVDRCALFVHGVRNEDFKAQLTDALALGTFDMVNNTFRILSGEEGYTTGSIERDKALADNIWKYAKTIGNRMFGDKLQVDQRTISITVRSDDTDW